MDETQTIVVALGATVTALATGLGALPFLRWGAIGPLFQARANAVAAGVMVAASVGLVAEGRDWSQARTVAGLLVGAVFVVVVKRALPEDPHRRVAGASGAGATKVLLIIIVMTAHSAAEGIGVGVAYGGGTSLGLTTTLAIAVHNIPEGLAIALVMIPRGSGVATASLWSIGTSLPQPLLAVPAFLVVGWSLSVLPLGLGFAAGAMIWMALFQLIPDSLETATHRQIWPAGIGAFLVMLAFQALVGT
jgi:zinc transporter ZupT